MSIQNISLHVERPNLSADPANQINAFRQQLNILGDSSAKDENKLKAAQELNESFDIIIAHPQYQTFLDHAMRVFLKLLQVKFFILGIGFTAIFSVPGGQSTLHCGAPHSAS